MQNVSISTTRLSQFLASHAISAALLLNIFFPTVCSAKPLRIAVQGSLASLDPHLSNETFSLGILSNVMEGLIRRDHELRIQPGLATHWEELAPKHWRFHLRRGVTFHDGSAFSADDVVFSMKRARGPLSQQISRVPAGMTVRKIDAFTVDFLLQQRDAAPHRDWEALLIMSADWARRHGMSDAGATPLQADGPAINGTGAYRVLSHQAGQTLRLERHEAWWGAPLYQRDFKRVDLHTVRIAQTRTAALLSRQVDLITPAPLEDLQRIASTAGLKVVTGPELRTIFLNMDQMSATLAGNSPSIGNPLRDVRVRRALYHAIDAEAITRYVMRGHARVAGTLVSPAAHADAATIARLAHDKKRARALLKEAGFGDGFVLPMDCPNDRYVNDGDICELIAAMLGRVGITVRLHLQTKSLFFSKALASGGYASPFNLIGWTPGTIDGLNVLQNVARCRDAQGNGGRFNLGGYCNPLVDQLAKQADVEIDAARRTELITRAFRLVHEDVGFIPLHQQTLSWGMTGAIDARVRADNQIRLELIRRGPGQVAATND